jgi:cytoskeletal protein RodZ
MQLNEILEENSVKAISKRTNISEDNIEALLASNFDSLKKVKTLGFISILEREYKADLSALKEQALSHYAEAKDEESIALGLPVMEEKKGRSKLFILFVFLLLGYASWYFFTQFDKKQLSGLLPFNEEKTSQIIMPKEADNDAELSIENVTVSTHTDGNRP